MIIVAGLPLPVIVMFVLVAVVAPLVRYSVLSNLARRVTRGSRLDPNEATKVAMLTPNGINAAYVAASLDRPLPGANATTGLVAPPTTAGAPRSVEQRLDELIDLRARGLITLAEFQTRRQQILDTV